MLWNRIKDFLLGAGFNLEVSKIKIMFGVKEKPPDSIVNFTILVGKSFIWNCKYQKKNPDFLVFKSYFKNTLNVLKEMYYVKDLYDMWQPWEYMYNLLVQERGDD
jgi:hypothetical protein